MSGVHISDLTALYSLILQNVVQGNATTIPNGKKGYYFSLAHDLYLWEVLDHLALALKARGLVTDAKTEIYPDDEAAAKSLGVPVWFKIWVGGYVTFSVFFSLLI